MPPMFRSTRLTMRNDIRDQRWMFWGALPASLFLHLIIAALLVFGLPVSLLQPQKEEAISVELVPPPKPSGKAKVEPAPPAEKSKSGKSQEANVEIPPPTSDDAARQGPSPVLKPVFQFGEKDVGPRESPDGNSAEDGSPSPTALRKPDKQDLAEPPAVTAVEATSQAPQPGVPETSSTKPVDAAKVRKPLKLQEAKTLFSQTATGDPMATTAMRDVPRGVRAGQLCLTELREQLLNALPPYFPDLLPSFGLEGGSTTIEVLSTAFRANRQWYDLSYRCEVDTDAMKVVSFAYRVGDPVRRSEWKRRGLPSQ